MTITRVALANLTYPESPAAAVTRAEGAIAEAGASGASIVCFPECYIPGYRMAGKPASMLLSALISFGASIGAAFGLTLVGVTGCCTAAAGGGGAQRRRVPS